MTPMQELSVKIQEIMVLNKDNVECCNALRAVLNYIDKDIYGTPFVIKEAEALNEAFNLGYMEGRELL